MPGPRYQHTAEELRHVADILDVLNAGDKNQIVAAAGGTIDIYWSDSLIGRIDRDDETWVYLPEARRPPQRSGDITWESQDPDAIIRVEIINAIGYEVWIHSDTFVDPQEAIDHARNISKGHPLDAILAYCNASDDVPPEIHDAAAKMLNVGSLCHGS